MELDRLGALGQFEPVLTEVDREHQEQDEDHDQLRDVWRGSQGGGITIEPWDYRCYAEKVRKAKYDLDSDEVKQYVQLDKLVDAMHMVASEIFGFKFTPVPEGTVPVFHPDVRVFEVTNNDTGEHIGLWYLDAFARQGKRSGARGQFLSRRRWTEIDT